eukprot:751974-Hanusia_phi.AAC.2
MLFVTGRDVQCLATSAAAVLTSALRTPEANRRGSSLDVCGPWRPADQVVQSQSVETCDVEFTQVRM